MQRGSFCRTVHDVPHRKGYSAIEYSLLNMNSLRLERQSGTLTGTGTKDLYVYTQHVIH